MNMAKAPTVAVALGMLVLVSQALDAQAPMNLPTPDPTRCSAADQTLRTGSLAQSDSQEMARAIVSRCPNPGPTLAAAMERRRGLATPPPLKGGPDQLYFTPTTGDTALLRVALSIVNDAGAGLAAHVLSHRVLLSYVGGGTPLYEEITATAEGDACISGGSMYYRRSSNLPSDSLERIRQGVAPLEYDATQHAHVRTAAHCVMNAWRSAVGLPIQMRMPNPRPALSVDYVCGNRFRVKNTLPHTVTVQYEATGSTSRSKLYVPPKPVGASHGDVVIKAPSAGQFRVVFDGDVILTKANGGTTCP